MIAVKYSLGRDVADDDGSGAERGRLARNWRVILGIAATALVVLTLQYLWHGHFSAIDEYDDGVYLGASINLSHGVLPYRDFAFIQPPMITVWMLPFAFLSSWTGTAAAMEAGRYFVDLVCVTNVVLLGALVRRRSMTQVIIATGAFAFSQGTIRSSQTILIEPFLVLACLVAFLLLMDGEAVTVSSRRLWWAGAFFGVAGATKVWAALPFLAALIVLSPSGFGSQRKVVGGAIIGFLFCTLPFMVGAPGPFFQQVVVTQAIRNAGGFPFLQRAADLTGIPGFSTLSAGHRGVAECLLALLVVMGIGVAFLCWRSRGRPVWTPLERLSLWSMLFVAAALLISPTYYYHYSGFMAPFVALVASAVVVRLREPLCRLFSVRSQFLPGRTALLVASVGVTCLFGAVIVDVLDAPAAPQVSDAMSDAIPVRGCVLYLNPTLALLDNRFTSDVSGCPEVIDWLGQSASWTTGSRPPAWFPPIRGFKE